MAIPTPAFGSGASWAGEYAPIGMNAGYGFGRAGAKDGLLVGVEASYVRNLDNLVWYGAYSDGVYDRSAAEARLSLGPEFGWMFLGIDGGYLVAIGKERVEHGFTVRPMLTTGVVTLYARGGVLLTGAEDRFAEVGALVKWPLWKG